MANDPYWNNTVLAMHMDGADNGTVFTDEKGKTITRVGNVATKIGTKQFGTASAYFDGSADSLTAPYSADWNFGSGNFTIEAWVYQTARPASNAQIVGTLGDAGSVAGFRVLSGTTGGTYFSYYSGSSTYTSVSLILPLNTWSHLAWSCSSGSLRVFLNGVQQGSTHTMVGAITNITSSVLRIGGTDATNWSLAGYIDDLRITKGVARYTSDFTVPSAAFPNAMVLIAGTVKDASDAFAARTVRVHRRSDGAVAGTTTSNGTTGAFSIAALDNTAHYAVCLDDGTPDENALIFDNITPV